MSIVKRNDYITNQNLTNLSLNVDLNRVTDDKTYISVNFGTTPATVTIKEGSLIEVNGNLYNVTLDETFQISNSAHNYIIFDGTTFSSASTIGTERADKGGWYQADNISRTTKWYIDQTNAIVKIWTNDNQKIIGSLDADGNTKIQVKMLSSTGTLGKIPFNSINIDTLNEWDTTNRIFTAKKAGYYKIDLDLQVLYTGTTYASYFYNTVQALIYKNVSILLGSKGTTEHQSQSTAGALYYLGVSICSEYVYLLPNDTIQFNWNASSPVNTPILTTDTKASIMRIA